MLPIFFQLGSSTMASRTGQYHTAALSRKKDDKKTESSVLVQRKRRGYFERERSFLQTRFAPSKSVLCFEKNKIVSSFEKFATTHRIPKFYTLYAIVCNVFILPNFKSFFRYIRTSKVSSTSRITRN